MKFSASGYETKPSNRASFFMKNVHSVDSGNLMAINMAFYYSNNNRMYDSVNGDGTGGAARKDPNKFDCSEFAAHATRNFVKAMQSNGKQWSTNFNTVINAVGKLGAELTTFGQVSAFKRNDPSAVLAEKQSASGIKSLANSGKLKEGMLLYHVNPNGSGHVAMVTRNLETGKLSVIESHGGLGLRGGVSTRDIDTYLSSPGQQKGKFVLIDPYHKDRAELTRMENRFVAMQAAANKVFNSPNRRVSGDLESQAVAAMRDAVLEVKARENNMLPKRVGVTPMQDSQTPDALQQLQMMMQKQQPKGRGLGILSENTPSTPDVKIDGVNLV